MILIGCVFTLMVGMLVAHVLRTIDEGLSSVGTDTWAYYFSGAIFAVSLALPVIVIQFCSLNTHSLVIGLPTGQLLRLLFLFAALMLSLYPVAAQRFRIIQLNVVAMSSMAVVISFVALGVVFAAGGSYGGLDGLFLVTLVLALVPSQVALGRVHALYEPD